VTGTAPGLVNRISDYADQHNPNFTSSYVYGMAVSGGRLYVEASNHVGSYTDSYFWIDVYDVSDPLHPSWITAVESNSDGALFSVGPYLYSYANADLAVTGYPVAITVYSVQSGVPVLKARTQVPQWSSMSDNQGILTLIPLSGNAPAGSTEVLKYDVTTGTITSADLTVTLPSEANTFSPDTTLAVGNRLFVSVQKNDNSGGEILTYDLSTSPPILLGAEDGRSLAFYASGNLLFGGLGGMNIYDISSQRPQFQSHLDGIIAQRLSGTQLLAFTGQQGCRMVDVSNPQNPRITATFFDGVIIGCNFGVLVGNYFYVSEYVGGIGIYDASQRGGPIFKKRLYGGGANWSDAYDLLLQSPYLYAASSTDVGATLNVYDISTTPPARVGEYFDGSQEADALESSGQYLYLGMSSNTAILNVSQPASPVLVGTIPVAATSLARTNNTLFAGTANDGLAVIDITNPAQPTIVRTLLLTDFPLKVKVSGNLLFVADSSAGLLIYDISTPTAPVLLSKVTSFAAVADVGVTGTTVFVAADVDGLGIINVSNPAQPVVVSKTALSRIDPFFNDNPPNEALSVALNNGIVYVGTLNANGLVFGLDCTNLVVPRVVSVYAHGDFILTWVGSLVFSGTDLFVGGSLGFAYPVAQVDMSLPRNSISYYFPPSALQSPAGLGNVRHSLPGVQLGKPGSAFRSAKLKR
jgi:hypothetical protein